MIIETVNTISFSMNYCRFGRGENALVILPGLSVQRVLGAAEAIAEAYSPLAEHFTVYVFERRNDLPAAYSVCDMARDTAEVLEALHIESAALFGASQGGMIALKISIEHPARVSKLILGSACARVTDALDKTVEGWLQLAERGDALGLYMAFGCAVYPQNVFEQSKTLLMQAAENVTDEDLQRFTILAQGLKGFDVLGDLNRIACPVLVLSSKDDKVMGSDAFYELNSNLHKCEYHVYDGYGHAAYDLAPDYKARMLSFLLNDKKYRKRETNSEHPASKH